MPVNFPDQPLVSFQRSPCDHHPAIFNDSFRHTDNLVFPAERLKKSDLFILQRHYLMSCADQLRKSEDFFQPEKQRFLVRTDEENISWEEDLFFLMPFSVISFHLFTVRDKASFQYILFYHLFTLPPDFFLSPGFYLYYIPHAHPSVHFFGAKGYASPFRLPFSTQIICQ